MTFRFSSGGYPLQKRDRVLLLVSSLLLTGGFLLARWLEPDPRGFGTHQRLGLPPCTFRFITGLPCPSCGMTTCFAHFTRGQWRQAAAANAAGVLLAMVCVVLIPWFLLSAGRGSLIGVSQPGRVAIGIVFGMVGVSVVVWIMQIWQTHN